MATVSVIIPNYNHASFLNERIDSVLNQTFQDFEVIILDDRSTDNSKEIIEQYRNHPKIKNILYNETNSGSTFKQWEKGISLAKGEWIWIAESDDVADKNFLESLLSDKDKNQDIVVNFCASYLIDEKSQRTGTLDWALSLDTIDWKSSYINDGKDEILNKLFYKNVIPNASAVIFKKEAVQKNVFKIISKMKFAGDWFFWIKILECGKISYNPAKLNDFRIHSATTRTRKPNAQEIIRFKEYFYILNYVSSKYKVSWQYKYHYWIMKEFNSKLNLFNSIDQFKLIKYIPGKYKLSFLKNSLLNKISTK